MPAVPSYGDAGELKAYLGLRGTAEDETLESRLATASRLFDRYTRRPPGGWLPSDGARTFDVPPVGAAPYPARLAEVYGAAPGPVRVRIDSLLAVTDVETDDAADGLYSTAWAATDYILTPYNAPPYRAILATPRTGQYSAWPPGVAMLRITGTWGEALQLGDDVAGVVYLIASRLRARAKSPEGILGDGERGFVLMGKMDPDVAAALEAGGFLDVGVYA